MKNSLTTCPVCGNTLTITSYHCNHCDTTIEGHFSSAEGVFSGLTPEQLNFVVTFIRCEGRLNRMEDELKMSYPTLRSRLTEIIKALGFEPGKEEPASKGISPEERMRILEDIDSGKLSFQEAKKIFQGDAEK